MKKFYAVVGNPPYQIEGNGNKTYAPPIYHEFMDAANAISDRVELITPARFLFDAGSTPKSWNEKMLRDEHFKVEDYQPDASLVFPGTDIKGGVAITYRDTGKSFGRINVFIPFVELKNIVDKVSTMSSSSIAEAIFPSESYRFTEKMHNDHPDAEAKLSRGHKYDFKTSVLANLDGVVFHKEKNGDDDIKILGLIGNNRVERWISRSYISGPVNFEHYKVFVPKSNGSGALGEVLSTPLIGQPLIGHTQTFISIGCFSSESEASACLKYIKTRFARVLLGVLKVTQDNPAPKWKYVPLQDFTSTSDIDWSQSVSEVDQQLYRKYGLDADEIEFIESHVKEMN